VTSAETAAAAKTPDAATVKKHMTPAQLALGDPVVNSVGMVLVPIPAGQFQMGSPDSDKDVKDKEKPQHLVKITKPFYLSVNEVTQQQYEKVMGVRPWKGKKYVQEGPDYPATYVGHDAAVEFCRKLSEQEGVEYRLPTEAQWEYACRAGTKTVYSFGDDSSKLGQHAWYYKNAWDIGEKYAHRVGQKQPNPWGLYDIHGNVWEWCGDWYGKYEGVAVDDPASGRGRVLRGGSFLNEAGSCRSAFRDYWPLDFHVSNFGFRVSRTYN
jgi:formylglycine-generating enzyme required for sulfatase activity